MTPDAVIRWLAEVKNLGLAKTDKEAGALIGLSPTSIVTIKRTGVTGDAAYRTALACAAVLAGLAPYR